MTLVHAFGSWSWRWSQEAWRTINSNTIRMLRIIPHVAKHPENKALLDWHLALLPDMAAPEGRGNNVLCQVARR